MAMTNDKNNPAEDEGDGIDRAIGRVSDMFNKVTQIDFTRKPTEIDRFFRAVKTNKLADVKQMLDQGFDPNSWNVSGDTPLHVAARANHVEMAALLTDAGADPRKGKKDDNKHLPLDDAVNFGKPEMTEFLARHGGYLPGNTVDGWSLLHRACEKGKPRLVKALLDAGADGNEPTKNGATPLLIAVMRAQGEVAEILLEYPAVINGLNSLFTKTDSKERNAFQLAVERGMSTLVDKMIDKGILPNAKDADGWAPLQHAITRGDTNMIRVLIKAGADINADIAGSGTPLLFACDAPEIADDATRAQVIDTLLRYGADADKAHPDTGETPLMRLAAQDNRSQTLATLLAYPVDLNICDKQGMNAVFHALRNPQNLRQLLDVGAGVDARHMKDASTPLIAAAKNGSLAAVQLLLAAGANPMRSDAADKSALAYAHKAHNDNKAEIVRALESALHKTLRAQKKKTVKGQAWDL
jgi:cytohesin